jgi:plasmid maintenance system killer protein
MELRTTREFDTGLAHLPEPLRLKALDALERFASNPRYPGLHLEKLRGSGDRWSIRVNLRVRIVFRYVASDSILLIGIGGHEIYR